MLINYTKNRRFGFLRFFHVNFLGYFKYYCLIKLKIIVRDFIENEKWDIEKYPVETVTKDLLYKFHSYLVKDFLFKYKEILKDRIFESHNVRWTIFKVGEYYYEVRQRNGFIDQVSHCKSPSSWFYEQDELQTIIK